MRKLIILTILLVGALNSMAAISNAISGFYPGNIDRNNVTQSGGMFINYDENGHMNGALPPVNAQSPMETFAQQQFDDYSLPGRIQPPNIHGDRIRKALGRTPTIMRRKQMDDKREALRRRATENGAQSSQ